MNYFFLSFHYQQLDSHQHTFLSLSHCFLSFLQLKMDRFGGLDSNYQLLLMHTARTASSIARQVVGLREVEDLAYASGGGIDSMEARSLDDSQSAEVRRSLIHFILDSLFSNSTVRCLTAGLAIDAASSIASTEIPLSADECAEKVRFDRLEEFVLHSCL